MDADVDAHNRHSPWRPDRFSAVQERSSDSSESFASRDPCERVRNMLRLGARRCEILTRLATMGEVLAGGGAVTSILVLDDQGLLRNAASPNLPADYLDAIDRLKPEPGLGTCASAAATGMVTITKSFLADEKWAELRHLPLSLGFFSAWSQPIVSEDGTVRGTFGTYYRDHREPSPLERAGVLRLAAAAALVLGSA